LHFILKSPIFGRLFTYLSFADFLSIPGLTMFRAVEALVFAEITFICPTL